MSLSVAGGKELPQSPWALPDPLSADPDFDVVALGADLDPATVLQGYVIGLFPMHVTLDEPTRDDKEIDHVELGWWSPNPRGVLPLDALRVTRSLRKSIRKYRVTFDTAFEAVMRACQRPGEEGQWITEEFVQTYTQLHRMGFTHSVEVWNKSGELVGGLYGVELGGLFAGESMFHYERDASKVALVALVEKLRTCPDPRLLDVQWRTEHLASMGVVEISRAEYCQRLAIVLDTNPCFD